MEASLVTLLPRGSLVETGGRLLLSCAAWVNVGLLCGHSGAVALRAAHRALTRVVCCEPQPQMYCFSDAIPEGLRCIFGVCLA